MTKDMNFADFFCSFEVQANNISPSDMGIVR